MKETITLISSFVLTILGFVVPLVGLLLSYFNEGFSKLKTKYQEKADKIEESIKEQTKTKTTQGFDIDGLEEDIKKLRKLKVDTEKQLSYFDPITTLHRLFIPSFLAFVSLIVSLLVVEYQIWLIILSVVLVIYTLLVLWKTFNVLTEVKESVDQDRKTEERKNIQDNKDILSEMISVLKDVKKASAEHLLHDVFLKVNSLQIKDVKDEKYIVIYLKEAEKNIINLSIVNKGDLPAKNIEAGIIFNEDFLVENDSTYTTYKSTTEGLILRNSSTLIHGSTNLLLTPITVTPLKKGEFKIKTFVKGENVPSTYRLLIFNVI